LSHPKSDKLLEVAVPPFKSDAGGIDQFAETGLRYRPLEDMVLFATPGTCQPARMSLASGLVVPKEYMP